MRFLVILALLAFPMSAQAFSYATGGCASSGCAQGEQWEYTNGNEIDTALDAIETINTTQTTNISTLTTNLANYLPLNGVTTYLGTMTMGGSASISVGAGTSIIPTGGTLLATGMLTTGQIDDNDLAAGAVDGGTAGEIADDSITAADIATGGVAGPEILDDSVTLTTDTAGNYVATVTGDTEITVSGAGTEGRAVTLAIASTIARQSALDLKSAASSTLTAVPKFSDTTGDLVDTGVTIANTTNNITTPGSLSAGGASGASTIVMRNTADSGWVECGVVTTTWTCAVDADGTPDGTL